MEGLPGLILRHRGRKGPSLARWKDLELGGKQAEENEFGEKESSAILETTFCAEVQVKQAGMGERSDRETSDEGKNYPRLFRFSIGNIEDLTKGPR